MNSNLLADIRKKLSDSAIEADKNLHKNFFKEEIKYYGVRSAMVNTIAKHFFPAANANGKSQLLSLCEELWQSGYLEECIIACNWTYRIKKTYTPEDFTTLERWVKNHISNWAACDTLCNHTMAEFITLYPQFTPNIIEWAKSDNRWVRRASAVTFIIPGKRGQFHDTIFKIANILLTDSDDMVQKGYGWMLKTTSQFDQKRVFDYVIRNKSTMPRTALRYAIEKMPPDMRAEAMRKSFEPCSNTFCPANKKNDGTQ